MKKKLLARTAGLIGLIGFICLNLRLPAAAAPPPHIKIVLVGTFHFGNSADRGKTTFPDLFSATRQAELQVLTTQLAQLKPDKFFVENEPSQQAYWDSIYTRYRQHQLDTLAVRNEIFQVGIRTARKAGLARVNCIDFQQPLPYDKMQEFEVRVSYDTVAQRRIKANKLLSLTYPYPGQTQKLADNTLADYLRYVNSPAADAGNRADYFVYAPAVGYGSDYTGVQFITSWYERNAKIFTNILRQTDPGDKLVILLIGSAHLLPLRHYFQNHPYFEVMELADVLPATQDGKSGGRPK